MQEEVMSTLVLDKIQIEMNGELINVAIVSGREWGVVESEVPVPSGGKRLESRCVGDVWKSALENGLHPCPDGTAELLVAQQPNRLRGRIVHVVSDGKNGRLSYIEPNGNIGSYPFNPSCRHASDCLYLFLVP
jgi:hypothetical protein